MFLCTLQQNTHYLAHEQEKNPRNYRIFSFLVYLYPILFLIYTDLFIGSICTTLYIGQETKTLSRRLKCIPSENIPIKKKY